MGTGSLRVSDRLLFWNGQGLATFYIENFGCRAARADGEAIGARLRADGLRELALADSPLADADVVVINTCSVTAEADRDARAFVRKTRRLNPQAKVVVTGCYAQRAPEEIAVLDGVAAVVGNSHKGLVPEIVRGLVAVRAADRELESQGAGRLVLTSSLLLRDESTARVWADDNFAHSYIENAQVLPGLQTRPNLKIQEGCGNRCTFCIIPTTRGGSRSLTAEKILAQVRGFVAAGGHELVLSGINMGRWGRDLDSGPGFRNLADLLRVILMETGLPRLRLSSIEPMDWTAELIDLMGEFGGRDFGGREPGHAKLSRLARHAHLPLQSGSDAVLRRMHRRYRPWHYAEKVAQLIEAVGPELAVGADVMVGFPGETDGEFRESFDFIQSLPFTYLHLFPFSARPGTRGWELHRESPVAGQAVKERMGALQGLIAAKARDFRAGLIETELPAITLHSPAAVVKEGRTSALTDNYLAVAIDGRLDANQLLTVRIIGTDENGMLRGESIQETSTILAEVGVAS